MGCLLVSLIISYCWIFSGDYLSREVKWNKWLRKAYEIEHSLIWLRRGETAEIVFGEFEEVGTDCTDQRMGKPCKTTDVKIKVVLADGSEAWRLIDKYTFVDLMKKFDESAKDGVLSKTLVYRRPFRRG